MGMTDFDPYEVLQQLAHNQEQLARQLRNLTQQVEHHSQVLQQMSTALDIMYHNIENTKQQGRPER